ncbi:hypothetical protein AB0M39_38025 [Streptomyces sp. NPDC051907]|uniref:hypothetical protein n=1 Tax=Streptomyces sp. NPDC051907 TaxID=3155284 RepID=UPI00341D5AB5
MMWPLSLLPVSLVAGVTVAVALCAAVNARRMRVLTHGAVMSNNPAAIAATERRVRRSWDRHRTYVLPTVLVGMALLVAQATACLAVALPVR